MATAAKTENLFESVIEFYLDQFEKLGPKVKQAAQDWFEFYGKAWEQYFKLQNDLFGQFASKNDASTEFTEKSKSFVQAAFNAQKDISVAAIDATLKNARAFSGKEKRKAAAGKKNTGKKNTI